MIRERPAAPDWVILAVACSAQFMVVLDVSIVNVALPQIHSELGFSASGLQWVINAYTLAFAGFLLLGGRAADLLGRRKVFLLGVGLFTVASLVGGFSQSPAMLIAARAAQGLGGAVLSPASLTILTTTFTEGRARARALGTWSAVAGAGGATGALAGGILTEYLNWRWILFVNVPIGALVTVAALATLRESRRPSAARSLDVLGAVLVTGGLVALVYGIVSTDTHPWTSARTLVTLGTAAVLLVAFVFVEARVARAPLMPLRLFASRSVSGANLVMLLQAGSLFAMWYFVSLYLQTVLHFDSLRAGLAFLPQTATIIVGSQVTGRLLPRTGPRPLLVFGALVTAAGFFWLSRITATSGYAADVLGPGMLITLGLGLTFAPIAAAATGGVPQSEAGLVSGLVNTSRQVGGAIGLAGLATVATTHSAALHAAGAGGPEALTGGFTRAFVVAGVICCAAAVAALSLPGQRRGQPDRSAAAVAGRAGISAGTSVVEPAPEPELAGRTIRGRVLGAGRQPLHGAAVTVVDMAGRQVGLARSGMDGAFSTTTPGAGAYLVVTSARRHYPTAELVSVDGVELHHEPVLRAH
ncbi:MAG TPA: MFS transporter [Pseudonocardiaceae bacterium]